eukprot:3333084-Rhodomonas_salina.2
MAQQCTTEACATFQGIKQSSGTKHGKTRTSLWIQTVRAPPASRCSTRCHRLSSSATAHHPSPSIKSHTWTTLP